MWRGRWDSCRKGHGSACPLACQLTVHKHVRVYGARSIYKVEGLEQTRLVLLTQVACGGSTDGDIRIFDARTDKAEALATVKVHRAPVTNMRLHPQLHAVLPPPPSPSGSNMCRIDTTQEHMWMRRTLEATLQASALAPPAHTNIR